MDRILNMVIRQVINRFIRGGINFGADRISRRTGGGQSDEDGSPEQRKRSKNMGRGLKQAARMGRRMGRF